MKSFLMAGVASVVLAAAAQAADLPTKKAPPAAPAAADCHASFMSWLDATPAACPLSFMGITVYGTLDMGAGYNTHATPQAPTAGINTIISKQSGSGAWQWLPSGVSTSNIGIKFKEEVTKDWFVIGDLNAQFDPQTLQFYNGPESVYQNNYSTLSQQNAYGDSSKTHGFYNNRAYVGVSNATLGTLTVGRQYNFSLDFSGGYDATGAANDFSLLGYTSTPVNGLGDTALARYNTSVKYFLNYNNTIHGGVVWQFGGFEQGNTSNGAVEADIGGTFNGFSFDAIYQHAKDAEFLSAFNKAAGPGAGFPGNTLKVNFANEDGAVLMTKYNYQQVTVYGGYAWTRLSTADDLYGAAANGTTGGWFVNGMNGGFPAIVQANAYVNPKVLQTLWTGVKYSPMSNLDLGLSYSHEWQNDYTNSTTKYNTTAAGGTATGVGCGPNPTPALPGLAPQGSNSGSCAGTLDVVGVLVDYRPVKRVDLYAGVAYSVAGGGIASGYQYSNNTLYGAGVKIGF